MAGMVSWDLAAAFDPEMLAVEAVGTGLTGALALFGPLPQRVLARAGRTMEAMGLSELARRPLGGAVPRPAQGRVHLPGHGPQPPGAASGRALRRAGRPRPAGHVRPARGGGPAGNPAPGRDPPRGGHPRPWPPMCWNWKTAGWPGSGSCIPAGQGPQTPGRPEEGTRPGQPTRETMTPLSLATNPMHAAHRHAPDADRAAAPFLPAGKPAPSRGVSGPGPWPWAWFWA